MAAWSTAPCQGLGAPRSARWPAPGRSWARGRSRSAPTGSNVYVASSKSDAIAIFRRDARTGALTQAEGHGRLHRRQRRRRLRRGDRPRRAQLGRGQPRRPQRLRDLAGEQLGHRLQPQPEDRRADASCRAGRGLHLRRCRSPAAPSAGRWSAPTWSSSAPTARTSTSAPSSATRSPSSTATRHRRADPARRQQPAASPRRPAAARPASPSARSEGLAISGDGASVYVATALSNAVVALARDHVTGALTQATDGSGCIVRRAARPAAPPARSSRAPTRSRSAPDGDVYVTSLFSNSVTVFTRSATTGGLTQKKGTAGCLVCLRAVGCSLRPRAERAGGAGDLARRRQRLRRRLRDRARSTSSTRNAQSGAVTQKPGAAGLPGADVGPRAAPAAGRCAASARSRSAPTAAISTRPRSAATPSTSSGGTR